jgi:hypothetical protein
VIRLQASGGVVQNLEINVNGQRKFLPIGPNCAVVLAMGAVESTRVALLSFPTPLMGRNLMVHLRTNLTVRIRRSALAPVLPAQLETGAGAGAWIHREGALSSAIYGLSITKRVFRGIDVSNNSRPRSARQHSRLAEHRLGHNHRPGPRRNEGEQSSSVPNNTGSWINLSPCELDEFGVARA